MDSLKVLAVKKCTAYTNVMTGADRLYIDKLSCMRQPLPAMPIGMETPISWWVSSSKMFSKPLLVALQVSVW